MKTYVIGTNGYLRLLLNDIPHQANHIESLLIKAKKEDVQIFLPTIVVFEILFVLEKYYHLGKDEILDKVESLVSMGYIEIESRDIFLEAMALYRNNTVSFVDCFLFVSAEKYGAELITFDKKLSKLS